MCDFAISRALAIAAALARLDFAMSTSDFVINFQPAQNQASEQVYAWVIVGIATICLALGFGANIVISVFMKPLEDEFGWLRADTSMAYAMNAIGAGAGGICWGGLSDMVGPRRIGVFGAIALSLGLIAMRWQTELWSLYLISFAIGAFGFATLFTPMVALAGRWFSARKGLAIGIVTAGGALGQGVVPYVAGLVITIVGWRDAAVWLGVAYLAVLLPLVLLLRAPADPTQTAPAGQAAHENSWGISHRISIPWLAFASVFCCICMAVPLVHLVPLGIATGCSSQAAAGLLLSAMIAAVFGRLFFGWLADRIGGLAAYAISCFAQTAVVFWFTQTSSIAALFSLSILFGFGFAGVMTCLLICAREAAPMRISGTAMAIVSTTAWVGMGIGSYQAGFFYDLNGSYVLSYGIAAIAGVVNLLVVAALAWYRWSRSSSSAPQSPLRVIAAGAVK
jgi:MFS family permease